MKTIWLVLYNADQTEGRGPMISNGIAFTSKEEGDNYIDDHPGVMLQESTLLDHAYEAYDLELSKARDSGLAKLTDLEKQALGLLK